LANTQRNVKIQTTLNERDTHEVFES